MKRLDLAPVAAGLVILLVWEGLTRLLQVPSVVLPPPSAVAEALLARGGILLPAAGVTLGLAMTALALSIMIGTLVALIFARIPWLERGLGPYALVLQATPIVAIAPLVIIWSGIENPRRAILILAVIVAVFPVLTSALAGLKAVDPGLDRVFRLHRASSLQRFIRLELPTAAPFLLAGVKTAAGLSLVGVVVAEFVAGTGATGGLSWRLVEAGNRLETATMFAALFLLALMGLALHAVLTWIERRIRA
ncbi:riboflavin transport system permease protein RibX [Candidatus Phycosocius bacilliformis]|uniref:Riboflavin transport system permease protein RibX n=1 Tax=Candidatus Phycosocius bacilliformis TaxID=1445552 RepID=A0A2P2E634_9PROT|nr:ABC transporter permease [Candidatus Phycosocius bacilliformis]GBF56518.1 riboflavin transport system permease protein RibX [Candidatus Phycosocius bacilliformis]